jgi:dienelactone hydrolase
VRVCLAERFYLVTNRGGPNLTETDSIFPAPKRHESEDILAKTGQPYQINLFSGVEHGFAVRADISNPIIRFAKESAFTQAVAWFNQYL